MRPIAALCGISCVWLALACSGGTSKNDDAASGGQGTAGAGHGQSGGSTSGGSTSGGSTSGAATSGGATSVGPNAPLTDYPRLYAASTCVLLERCLRGFAAEVDACTDSLELALREQVAPVLDQAVKEGRVAYQSNALPACLAALEKASCDEVLFTECTDVFVGSKKTGESCVLDIECAEQQQCAVSGTCPGSCAPAGKAGEACSTYNRCAPGFTCASEVCVATAKLGQPCGTETGCQGYGFCSGRGAGAQGDTGTCVARNELATSGQDEPCESFGEPLCKPGFVCTTKLEGDVVVGSCQKPVASGASCTYSTPDPCPEGEYCSITSAVGVKPATGACQPRPKVGEKCLFEDSRSAICVNGSKCDVESTLCLASSHLGEPCTKDGGCYSDTCVDGKCVPRVECEESERAL
jgi:hypothetical protein